MESVEGIMVKRVVTAGPSETIHAIRLLMLKHGIGRVVVVREGRPIGIVTQKDVVRFLLDDTSKRGIDEIPVEEAMSRDPITVDTATPIHKIGGIMMERGISSLVVVDEGGTLKGIVTKTDICHHYGIRAAGIYRVRDFMTPNPITVKPSHSIFLVASLMAEHRISRVIVGDGGPLGIITLSDLTMVSPILKPRELISEGKYVSLRGLLMPSRNIGLLTARDIMTSNPISMNEEDDLAKAAGLMIRNGISGLPVVDDEDRLVGIVTKSDVTRATVKLKED